MQSAKQDIIRRLRTEINNLEGFKPNTGKESFEAGLGRIRYKFPNQCFPRAAVHEFLFSAEEDAAATCGFISGILASLMKKGASAVWIGAGKKIFPPALSAFGLSADKIFFMDLHKEKDILWATEEALKCKSLAAVITETGSISMIASRRLQLAAEQNGVTGFIIHRSDKSIHHTACVARWRITSLPSLLPQGMPGVGFPRWNVELLKVRNGSGGSWQIEFNGGRFRHIIPVAHIEPQKHKQTG